MPNQWSLASHGRSETLGANTADSSGTDVTASGTANVKGSWVDVGGVTSFAYEEFVLFVFSGTASANTLVDIGINVGGNRFVIAEDLDARTRGAGDMGFAWPCPVHVPAGAQLSARCQSGGVSFVIEVVIVGNSIGLGGRPGAFQLRRLSNVSGSRGTTIDPGGTAHTKVRTDITASTPVNTNGIILSIGEGGDAVRAANGTYLFDLEMGASGSEQVLLSDLLLSHGLTNDTPEPRIIGWFSAEIPAGIKLSVNAQGSSITAGDRIFDILVYGLVR